MGLWKVHILTEQPRHSEAGLGFVPKCLGGFDFPDQPITGLGLVTRVLVSRFCLLPLYYPEFSLSS